MKQTRRMPTRDALLGTCVTLIRRAAHAGDVTVRNITDAAGANLNAVNYHFGSKEQLIREAVRTIIAEHYRARGIAPGSSGRGLHANLVRIADFLFTEPVAARLALESELTVQGAGPCLTSETMGAIAELLHGEHPSLSIVEARFRALVVVAVVHLLLLRPAGAGEWLGADPGDAGARSAILADLCRLVGSASPVTKGRKGT